MTATITYKGNTLATASNNTKVLETEGTYLEDDITITDVTSIATLITKSITANGTYNASSDSADGYSSVTVNVSGGGGTGLVYETGTYTPTSDRRTPNISFANSHSTRPFFASIFDMSSSTPSTNSMLGLILISYYDLFETHIEISSTLLYYGMRQQFYKGSSGATASSSNISSLTDTMSSTCIQYYISNTEFTPNSGSDSRLWRSGRTYKWIAVWAPTS